MQGNEDREGWGNGNFQREIEIIRDKGRRRREKLTDKTGG